MALADTLRDYHLDDDIMISDNGMAHGVDQTLVKDLLIGSDSFDLSFDLTPSASGETGEILRYGTSFIVEVKDGELFIRAETETGDHVKFATTGANLDAGNPRSISISLADGFLSASVDGTTVGEVRMPSPITVNGWDGHDLYIGNPWSRENYEATLSNLEIVDPDRPEENSPEMPPVTDKDEESYPVVGAEPIISIPEDAIRVDSLEGLYAALAEADGGETIALAPGDYGKLSLTMKSGFDYTYDSDVTIMSADPSDRAQFGGIDIRQASHLVFNNLAFDYTFSATDPNGIRPFSIAGSRDVKVYNSIFDGDKAQGISEVDDDHGWGVGLYLRGSQNVLLEGNEFLEFHRGAVISDSEKVIVRGNDLHDIRMDGLNFAAVREVLIEKNTIRDFDRAWGSSDHSDMIQFWTNGTDRPSTDITIRENHLDIGAGGYTQSIFMRNEEVDLGRAGSEMFYQDILIEDNVIVNAHLHGISVGETDGLTIRANTVLHSDGGYIDGPDSAVEIPRISVAGMSRDVMIESNITSTIAGWTEQSDWTLRKNAFVQDQDSHAAGYYGDVFVSSSLEASDEGLHSILVRAGGMVEQLRAGAAATYETGGGVQAAFQILKQEGEAGQLVFDARYSTVDGVEVPANAEYTWTFSDGSTAAGPVIVRSYDGRATEAVRLDVTLPDGRTSDSSQKFDVAGPKLVGYSAGQDFTLSDGSIIDDDDLTAAGLDLGKSGVALDVNGLHLRDLVGADEFNFSFGLRSDGNDSQGEVFRYGTSLVVSVTDDGQLAFNANTEGGRVQLRTPEVDLSDMLAHEVEIAFKDDRIGIYVDGNLEAETDMVRGLAGAGNHGIYFGNPWGRDNFEGVIDAFELTREQSDFERSEIFELTGAELDLFS